MQALLYSQDTQETGILTVILQQMGLLVQNLTSLEEVFSLWLQVPLDLVVIVVEENNAMDRKQIIQLRAHTAAPILLISEALSGGQQVQCYEDGIDLLVVRPFDVRVLAAQIRALLRRTGGVPFFSLPSLTQLDITLDPASREVIVGENEPKRLTQLEFRLLYTLMTHAKQIISTERIVEQVWGYSGEGNRDLVRGLVQRLRTKVEPDPHNPRYVLTEPGVGYSFNRQQSGGSSADV